jgi:hypothetical protein
MTMRLRLLAVLLLGIAAPGVRAYQDAGRIRGMEPAGDAMGARAALAEEARNRPNDVAALTNYAEFLDRHGDPECRDAYRKLLAAIENSGNAARAASISRRLARLDLLAGDREAAARDLEANARATGKRLAAGDTAPAAEKWPTVQIPGPMRSFARMAALPQDADPADVFPALARNVMTSGYQTGHGSEAFEPTEYLKLVYRYLSQARELQTLAGAGKVIRIEKCESPAVADLLHVLGYRMRGGCGSEVVLETVNAARAFITSDSGFPINALEQALRVDRPFSYDYAPAAVPVVFGPDYWTAGSKESADFVETLIGDPSLCRLYLAFAKLDRETAESLRTAVAFTRLKTYAHVLDFYGGMFAIRNGKAVTPGGARTEAAWAELVGAAPAQAPQFFDKLIAKDDGWMASLYDALARIHGPVEEYLTEPTRLKRFYAAIRGRVTTPGPARPVMRANADMMLLTTRLRIEPDGKPHIPGDLEIWKNLFAHSTLGKYDVRLSRQAPAWKDPDDLLEALFALCRKNVENQPLKIFMAVSDVDRNRAVPLAPATVERLVREYPVYRAQYAVFSESPALTGKSMGAFLDTAGGISRISAPLLRADSAGVFQSLVGLWQILARQENIPENHADAVFASMVGQFGQIRDDRGLFDAGVKGLDLLLAAAHSPEGGSGAPQPQESLLDLLAGVPAGADTHEQLVGELAGILDAQRVVSLDALYQLADRLDSMARGEKPDAARLKELTGRFSEIQLPRPALSNAERIEQLVESTVDKHLDAERGFNPRTAIQKAAGDPVKLKEIRGMLAPWLRDTLLAFNYAYYSPPKAQVLFTNPLYVRSHDFIGPPSEDALWRAADVAATGWPSNGGGRLIGSLAGLPYALAAAEQNFLVPTHTQALIWADLVPQVIVSATLPRWGNVTADQVHWVGLNLRYAREALAESVFSEELRTQALEAMEPLATPARIREIGELIERGDVNQAAQLLTPSELFSLARALAASRKDEDSAILTELRELARRSPKETNYTAISRAFGTPKPTLTNSYRPELLNLRTFPTLMGYSSRILAESWESNTLYWVALADELYLPPAQLNVKIPEWTGALVEHIFASNLDDWPAMVKSLRVVGADERARAHPARQQAALEGGQNR